MRTQMLIGAILTTALVAGCGGSSYKGLSKQDFITQADAICKKYDDQITAATQKVDASADQKKLVDVLLNDALPAERTEVKELRKLKPPKADRTQIKQLLDSVDAGTAQAEKDLKSNPTKVFSASYDPYKDAGTKAKAYGFQTCGGQA